METEQQSQSKMCPFIPPVPIQGQLHGGKAKVQFFPCMAEVCAIFDTCQGDCSPRALEERRDALFDGLLEALETAPFIGPHVKRVRATLFEASEAPEKPPVQPASGPVSGGFQAD